MKTCLDVRGLAEDEGMMNQEVLQVISVGRVTTPPEDGWVSSERISFAQW